MTTEKNSITEKNIELYLPFCVHHKIGNIRFYKEYTNSFKTYEEAEKFFQDTSPLCMFIKITQVFVRIDNEGCFEIDCVTLKEKDYRQTETPDLHIC